MFILIMGITGSGKTTVATLLSAALGWPFYDADDFHSAANVHKMASSVSLTDEDRGPWLEKLRTLISERIARGEDGILACSALKEAYRKALSTSASLFVVYLKADADLIRSRLADRRNHHMPQSLIESQFLDLEEPEEAITIPAAWPPDQIVRTILSQLGR